MERANISTLKNRLSAYLRMVQAGETVLVLERNRAIARIERIGGPREVEGRVGRLGAAGVVRVPMRKLPLRLLAAEPPRAKRSVLASLLNERAESR
jgi:antitoxin (DNA-binding transcriptional repressor) of toxin-antitoxin stability system